MTEDDLLSGVPEDIYDNPWVRDAIALLKQLATERARADKAEADARRYRWLRSWTRVGHWSVSRWRVGEGRYEPVPQEAKMDAAIDKAMKDA